MAKSTKFLTLLRGINVGGKNVIPMKDLKQCFEDAGCSDVVTYIQSGNILFRASGSAKSLTETIESALSERFDYSARAVVIPHTKYKSAVKAAPAEWGNNSDQKHNALFTLAGVTPSRVLAKLPEPKPDIEQVSTGPGVIFWSASTQYISRTTMMKLAKAPEYQELTVRNHNTVLKLLDLFETI